MRQPTLAEMRLRFFPRLVALGLLAVLFVSSAGASCVLPASGPHSAMAGCHPIGSSSHPAPAGSRCCVSRHHPAAALLTNASAQGPAFASAVLPIASFVMMQDPGCASSPDRKSASGPPQALPLRI
jgi:hypothetical protein